ncbi:hypothetical protein ABG067_005748 [Albugo candida]
MIPIRCMIMYLPLLISLLSCYSDAQQPLSKIPAGPIQPPPANPAQPPQPSPAPLEPSSPLPLSPAPAIPTGSQTTSMTTKIILGQVKMNAALLTCAAIIEPMSCQNPLFFGTGPLAYNELVLMKGNDAKPPTTPPPGGKPAVPPSAQQVNDFRYGWITEQTIIDIKARGFNSIKIKFGFWLVGEYKEFSSPRDFIEQIMRWTDKHDIGVYLTYAAVFGCQNFQPVANCPNNLIEWGVEPNRQKNIDTIVKVWELFKSHPSLMAINPLYEPSLLGANNIMLTSYYTDIMTILQKSNFDRLFVISPLGEKRFDDIEIKTWCESAKKMPNILISMSSYLYWEAAFDSEKKLEDEINRRGDFLSKNKDCNIIVDEWSVALKVQMTQGKLGELAEKQQQAYDKASKGTVYGPFNTTTVPNVPDIFSYTSVVDNGIIKGTPVLSPFVAK